MDPCRQETQLFDLFSECFRDVLLTAYVCSFEVGWQGIWEGAIVGHVKVLFQHLPKGTTETHEKSHRIVCLWAEIRTGASRTQSKNANRDLQFLNLCPSSKSIVNFNADGNIDVSSC